MIERAFFVLAGSKLLRIKALFKRREWAKILVAFVSLGIMALVAAGIFGYSYFVFKFLGYYLEYRQPVVIYSLAVTFLLTAVLSFFSSFITTLGTFFQRDDNLLLFSWPVSYSSIFELRLLDTLFLSNWPLFIFAFPVVMGYGLALSVGVISLILFAFGTLFLNLTATLTGVLLALFLSYRWGSLKGKLLPVLLLVMTPVFGLILIRLILPSALTQDLGPLSLEQIDQLLNRQAILSPVLPSTWMVNFVYFWLTDRTTAVLNWYLMVSFFLTTLILTWSLKNRFFMKTVDRSYVGRFVAGTWDTVKHKARPFPYLLKGKLGALTEKDWLIVFRSSAQLFELSFLALLQLIYFLIVNRIPIERFNQVFQESAPSRISALNFFFIGFLACVVSMRYFFPMISLEGQSSWIIWSAPIKRMKIFWQKFFPSFLIILTWMSLATFFSVNSIGVDHSETINLLFLNFPLALTITMITLGIGTLKPNFMEKNPEKLSTSAGGLLATFVCLAYIGTIGLILFFSSQTAIKMASVQIISWLISGLIILSIWFLIPRKIINYEI